MSIPRRDPNYKIEDLEAHAERFLEAGKAYWVEMHKAGMGGALAWFNDSEKGLVVFTRGEYHDTLLQNIHHIGPTHHFGATIQDPTEYPDEEPNQ